MAGEPIIWNATEEAADDFKRITGSGGQEGADP